jgi:hypothetical protein
LSKNRIGLEELVALPVGEAGSLSVEQLALLQSDLDAAGEFFDSCAKAFASALVFKYGEKLTATRVAASKDTGKITLTDGRFNVVNEARKEVKWDQVGMAGVVKTIAGAGDDPLEYVKIAITVAEAAYKDWPAGIRAVFEPHRSVTAKPGRIFLEELESATQVADSAKPTLALATVGGQAVA